jgi:hypothetical protein
MTTRPDGTPSAAEQVGEQVEKENEKRERRRLDVAKRWVGLGAALVSAGSAVYGALEYQADKNERARGVAEQLAASRVALQAGDYPAAWKSLDKATQVIDKEAVVVKLFGGLNAQQDAVHTAQQDLAMQWLRDAKLEEGQKYSDITDPVLGALSAGADSATGARKGDLLAHIGLAYMLKQNDHESTALHPERFLREALAADPTNPYANTFSGNLAVGTWPGSTTPAQLAEARQRFTAALGSSRSSGDMRQWVRKWQLNTLWFAGGNGGSTDWWQAVNEMHKAGESLSDRTLSNMRGEYLGTIGGIEDFEKRLKRILAFVSPADNLELLRMLLKTNDDPDRRGYLEVTLAIALEQAGNAQESAAAWRDAKTAGLNEYLGKQADAAIQRLAAGAPAKKS